MTFEQYHEINVILLVETNLQIRGKANNCVQTDIHSSVIAIGSKRRQ